METRQPRTRHDLAIGTVAAILLAPWIAAAGDRPVLALLPFGNVDDEAIRVVRSAIEETYGWEVAVLAREDLPESAYYPPRRRYRAERLLEWLRPRVPAGAEKIMGLTARDISTTKGRHADWGICGLAEIDGPVSVVSTWRIQRKLGRVPPAWRHEAYLKRLADLGRHEFGHQLGLGHCPNRGCLMEDARGTVSTFDRSTGDLCADCRAHLAGPVAPGGRER